MKRATIHLICDGEPVDFEIHDGGEVVVVGYDIDADLAAVELGFEPSECLVKYIQLRDEVFWFLEQHEFFDELFSGVEPLLTVSTAHMTEADDAALRAELASHEGFDEAVNDASGMMFHDLRYGYGFRLLSDEPPRDSVAESGNRDQLSDSLINVLQRAWEKGIYAINFDTDGLVLPGFETHDW